MPTAADAASCSLAAIDCDCFSVTLHFISDFPINIRSDARGAARAKGCCAQREVSSTGPQFSRFRVSSLALPSGEHFKNVCVSSFILCTLFVQFFGSLCLSLKLCWTWFYDSRLLAANRLQFCSFDFAWFTWNDLFCSIFYTDHNKVRLSGEGQMYGSSEKRFSFKGSK